MRTPADCINALNGCVQVGSGIGNMRLAVHETIAADIISHLQVIERMRAALQFISDREDYTFAECSLAEEIVSRAKAALQPLT